MLKKSIIFILSLFAVPLFGQEYSSYMEALQKSFETQDKEPLEQYLAPNFAISGHTQEGADFRLEQILKRFELEDIRLAEVKKTKGEKRIHFAFQEKSKEKEKGYMKLNDEDQILYISFMDSLYGLVRAPKSELVATIPFENKDGSILLDITINDSDKSLKMLFDTGADGMALSRSLADELGLEVSRENEASVVGASQTIQISDGNIVFLGDFELHHMGIAIFPSFSRSVADGIIGNTLTKRYITEIDYDRQELRLYTFGVEPFQAKGKAVSVSMPTGVTLLPGDLEIVENKRYSGNFVFDTGASYDLICFRPFVRENRLLVSGFKPQAQSSTVSLGVSSPTFVGRSKSFSIHSLADLDGLPVTLMGGSGNNENWKPGVDGSIGVRLLSRYNMTINMAENEIYFAPNNLHKYPQDFVYKDLLFGWNHQGELKLLSGFKPSFEEEMTKTAIEKIDDWSAKQLLHKKFDWTKIHTSPASEESAKVEFINGKLEEI